MNMRHYQNSYKIMALIICITCVISLCYLPSGNIRPVQADSPSYDGIIELNTPITVFLSYDLQRGSREATYQFTPVESCDYIFYSVSDQETACYLRSANGTMLDYDYTHHGSRGNFSLTCSLSAGSTYYFTAQFSEASSTEGSFDINLCKAVDLSSYDNAPAVSLSPSGIAESIPATGQSLFITFTPAVTGKYAIYQLPSCDCPDKSEHQKDCTYLTDLCITVSQKPDSSINSLETLYYSTAADKENGFLVYDMFEADITYYIEISCIEGNKTGDFKLGISDKLSDAPVEIWSTDEERELTLENSHESLFFQMPIFSSLTLQSSDSAYVYVEVLDVNGNVISQSTLGNLRLDYFETIASGNYYIRIFTPQDLTQSFHLSKICPAAPTPTVMPSVSPVASDIPKGTEDPKATPPVPSPLVSGTPQKSFVPEFPSASPDNAPSPSAQSSSVPNADPSQPAATAPAAVNLQPASEQPKNISQNKVIISKIKKQTFTGKSKKPSFTVTYNGKILTAGQDYTVKYQNNKKIGTAKAIISGISSYTGQRKTTFEIVPAIPRSIKCLKKRQQLSLSWKKAKKATGYEVQYSYQKNFKHISKKKTKKKSLSFIIKQNKKVYVRVRSYTIVNKKTYYGNFSKKIKK